jgi:hypothetical protein
MNPNNVNEAVTASHIRTASVGLRHIADQTRGKYFTQACSSLIEVSSPALLLPKNLLRPFGFTLGVVSQPDGYSGLSVYPEVQILDSAIYTGQDVKEAVALGQRHTVGVVPTRRGPAI